MALLVCSNPECLATFCACNGLRCPDCGTLKQRDPSKSVANLPFIASAMDRNGQPLQVLEVIEDLSV